MSLYSSRAGAVGLGQRAQQWPLPGGMGLSQGGFAHLT